MNKVTVLFFLLVTSLTSSCWMAKSGDDVYNPTSYICGNGSTYQYWVNDTGYALDTGGWSNPPVGHSIYVLNGNVYIAGQQWDGGAQQPVYLVNNTVTRLPNLPSSDSYTSGAWDGAHYCVNSIYVNSSNIYMAGNYGGYGGEYQSSLYWVTPTASPSAPDETAFNFLNYDSASANSIFVSGSDVYAAGINSGSAVYWLNGSMNTLSGGTCVHSIVVANGYMYMAGENNGAGAIYWTDSSGSMTYTTLPGGTIAYSLVLYNGQVYIAGTDGSNAVYWVDGTEHILSGGTVAYSVAISLTGDVYIAGTDGTNAVYWKNGVVKILPGGSVANSVFVE